MSLRTQPKDEDTGGDSFASPCVTIVEVFWRVDQKLPKPQALISRNPKRLKIPNKTRNPSSNRACFGHRVLSFRSCFVLRIGSISLPPPSTSLETCFAAFARGISELLAALPGRRLRRNSVADQLDDRLNNQFDVEQQRRPLNIFLCQANFVRKQARYIISLRVRRLTEN